MSCILWYFTLLLYIDIQVSVVSNIYLPTKSRYFICLADFSIVWPSCRVWAPNRCIGPPSPLPPPELGVRRTRIVWRVGTRCLLFGRRVSTTNFQHILADRFDILARYLQRHVMCCSNFAPDTIHWRLSHPPPPIRSCNSTSKFGYYRVCHRFVT